MFKDYLFLKGKLNNFILPYRISLNLPGNSTKNLNPDLNILKNLRNSNDIFCLIIYITEILDQNLNLHWGHGKSNWIF